MDPVKFECDCDRVIEMEDMAIGVEEILQYVRGVMTKDDIRALICGLEKINSVNGDIEEE
jgi:hypothetical protein